MPSKPDEVLPCVSRHVISFYWEDFSPHLIAYDKEKNRLDDISLSGDLDLLVSNQRRCVGFEDHESYHPCPSGGRAGTFGICRSCSSKFLPDQRCVFEPKCEGDLCDHPDFCVRDHVVYLAYFGTLMKVGMTSEKRLRERAIEQGADAIAPIFRCKGRHQAREMEREVSKRFKINQEYRAKRILAQLERDIPWEKIEAKYRNTLIRLNLWKEPLEAPLTRLDRYPFPQESISVRLKEVEGHHLGSILGAKGRYLIYRAADGLCALDLSNLPSRYVALKEMPDGR